jgi:hypothetical protein
MVQFGMNNMTGPGFASLINSVNSAHNSTKNLNAALAGLQVAGGEALMSFGRTAMNVFDMAVQKAGDFQMKMVMIQQAMGDPAKVGYRTYNLGLQGLAQQRMDLMVGDNPTLFGIDQLADIQRMLLQTGFTPGEITRKGSSGDSLGRVVAYLAEKEQLRGLSTSPTASAQNIAQFLKAYGLTGDAAYNAINTIAKVQTVTGHFSSQDMKYYEQYFGNLARTINMKPDDMIILSGFMSRMGATSTSGATALNNLFLQSLDPTKGASNFESNKRFEAAMALGMLGHVDVAQARRAVQENIERMQALGLPADPTKWTAAQQEKIARSALVSTMPNQMIAAYRKNGLQGMSDFLDNSRSNLEHEYGKQKGDDQMAVYLARLLNLRGARGGFILSAQDMSQDQRTTLGGHSALMAYQRQVMQQQPIDILIAQARNTLHGQEATSQNRFNAIMLQLGGVDMVTGKAIAGGPLDTVIKILKELNKVMAEVIKFNAAHPQAAGMIGTAIGGIGLLATIAGAAMTGLGVLGLARAGLGVGGGTVLKAGLGRMGGALGAFGPGAAMSTTGGIVNWLDHALFMAYGGSGKYASFAAGAFPRAPATLRMGNFMGDIAAKLGMNGLGGALGFLGTKLGIIVPLVFGFGLRMLNWVGWILLAVDALSWFSKHPKDIGTWIGYILRFLKDTLIPGVINVIKTLVVYIGQEFMKLLDLFTHPLEMTDWVKSFVAGVQQGLQDPPSTIKQGPAGHPNPHGKGGVTHVSINVDAKGASKRDANHIASVTSKAVVAALKSASYSTVGGTGIPGRPHAAVGAT